VLRGFSAFVLSDKIENEEGRRVDYAQESGWCVVWPMEVLAQLDSTDE
jgi:hypothetical protein